MKALVFEPNPFRWIACKLAGRFRPNVFWSACSCLQYCEIPEPKLPGPEWVRLRTRLGGICGTDLGLILQKQHPASYLARLNSFPMVLGHENVAVVAEVGSAVDGWRRGERVCVEPALGCAARGIRPLCPPCRRGQFSLCENTAGGNLPAGTMIGLNRFTGGSWAPTFVAHHGQLHRVPDVLSDREAILTDPVACALHGVLRYVPRKEDSVLVIGGGVIGMGVVACIRALGGTARITAVARHAYQQQWLTKLGADEVILFGGGEDRASRYDRLADLSGGRRVAGRFGNHGFVGGFDVVFDCVGSSTSIADSFKLTRARGTTVLLGTTDITLVDTTPMWNKELNVLGAYGRQMENYGSRRMHTYEVLFELLQENKLNFNGWLTHTFAPRDYRRAFQTLTARGKHAAVKAAFEFEKEAPVDNSPGC